MRVLPERITITSYPGPDRSISLANLEAGHLVARRYRNRRIGKFLKELRLTEGRGTGIPTVLRAMRENGSPLPAFDTDEDRTYFTVTLPVHSALAPQVTPQAESGQDQGGRMRDLLDFCTIPRDRVSIQARLNIQDRQHLRERYLVPAIAASWLTMTDPAHPNSPKQKY